MTWKDQIATNEILSQKTTINLHVYLSLFYCVKLTSTAAADSQRLKVEVSD